MSLSQVDRSWAGSIRRDSCRVVNHFCGFFEGSSSRFGFVIAAVGHSTPMTFCLIVDWYFHLPLSKRHLVSSWPCYASGWRPKELLEDWYPCEGLCRGLGPSWDCRMDFTVSKLFQSTAVTMNKHSIHWRTVARVEGLENPIKKGRKVWEIPPHRRGMRSYHFLSRCWDYEEIK